MNHTQKQFKSRIGMSLLIVVIFMTIFSVVGATNIFAQETPAGAPMTETEAGVAKFGLIAAALAFAFGAIGAGIAIANVGAAAMGAIAEKPEIAGQALIFIALAEGLVVFGFITALMILGRI